MTDMRDLERSVAAWMAEEATVAASDQLLGDMLAAATSSRPRPRWLASFTQSPLRVNAKVGVGSQTYRLALLAALLGLLLGATIFVASSLLRPDTAADVWPGFRGDASRSGVSATGPIGQPILAWRFQASGSVSGAIAIVDDLVVASSDDGVVHALGFDKAWSAGVSASTPRPPTGHSRSATGSSSRMVAVRFTPSGSTAGKSGDRHPSLQARRTSPSVRARCTGDRWTARSRRSG